MGDKIISFKDVVSAPDRSADLKAYTEAHRFSPDRPPKEDDSILFLQGIPIGSKENIITITGKSKSRKTIIASALATAMFKEDGFLTFSSDLSPDAKILHIDTEQGYKHYWHSVERIFKDAGLQYDPRFTSIHTRDADIPMRLELIDCLVESLRPTVLIIDGLTDLVYDINDQAEATKIGEKFLQISSKYQLLVIGVIHTTKTTGFMTGAIGTIFEKKSETVIKVELMEGEPMISNISCQFSRNKPFETFSIEADDHNNYTVLEESKIIKNGEKDYNLYSREQHIDFLDKIFDKNVSISEQKVQKEIKRLANSSLSNTISSKTAIKWCEKFKMDMLLIPSPEGLTRAFKPVRPLHDVQLKIDTSSDEDSPF